MPRLHVCYLSPASLDELWQATQSTQGKIVFLAGGSELCRIPIERRAGMGQTWIDLTRIPEMNGIEERADTLWIGACATYAQIARSGILQRYAAALTIAASQPVAWQIHNQATIGGTVAIGRSDADLLPPLYALNARILCSDGSRMRTIDIDDFYAPNGLPILEQKEVILGFSLHKQPFLSIFVKEAAQSVRPIGKVSVAVVMNIVQEQFRQVRLALGAVAPRVIRATVAEGLLEGQPISYLPLLERVADEARRIARPITDARSSARYRKWSVGILTCRAIRQMIAAYRAQDPMQATPTSPLHQPVVQIETDTTGILDASKIPEASTQQTALSTTSTVNAPNKEDI